jgi:hypothetical protein
MRLAQKSDALRDFFFEGIAMLTRPVLLAASAALMALALTACNRETTTTPKPKTDLSQPARTTGSAGGPASTDGGLTGNPAGGTPGGAATASTPEGMAPGAGTAKTDQGGLASRPTEGPQSGAESRPNTVQK